MKHFLALRRLMTFSALLISLTATTAVAQDLSDAEFDPVDATVFDAHAVGLEEKPVPGQPRKAALVKPVGTYRSDSLGGEFIAQWMQITIGGNQNGQSFLFWGARAVSLDKKSPLRDLQVRFNNGRPERFQVGDVVTRLDDIKISGGMTKNRKGVWQIAQLDEHYGPTTFRWIKTGHSHVNVSKITLLNNKPSRPNGGNRPVPVAP
ncbi:MAG: hypothetical protein ACI9HK_005554 [Pirellulaceae bacterium]|jgi:hypothetical protein